MFIEELAPTGALRGALRSALRRVLRSRKPGTHVVLVDMRGAWDVDVLARVLKFIGKHQRQNRMQDRIIRPVFLCGPEDAWKWLNETVPSDEQVELRDVWLGPCALDFTRTYLTDQESRAYTDLETPDQRVDLPWPLVVGTAARNKQLESISEAIRATLNDEQHRHVSDIMGISEELDSALRILSALTGDSVTADSVSVTADSLSELSEHEDYTTMSPEEVIDFFSWASRLGVVCRDGDGYRLDSTYAQGLSPVFVR